MPPAPSKLLLDIAVVRRGAVELAVFHGSREGTPLARTAAGDAQTALAVLERWCAEFSSGLDIEVIIRVPGEPPEVYASTSANLALYFVATYLERGLTTRPIPRPGKGTAAE